MTQVTKGRSGGLATVSRTHMEAILDRVRPRLVEVERRIKTALDSDSEAVTELVAHASQFQGKRLRPALLLLGGQICGELTPDHTELGVVVELIHTATLLHDDVLDAAKTRRRALTLNAAYDNHVAILLGDIVYSTAFRLANALDDQTAARVLAEITGRICTGEIEQNYYRGQLNLGFDEYFRIIEAKTALLYAVSAELGAHYAGGTPAQKSALFEYGRSLGMAFQIADDCLDLIGNEQRVGKSLGTDLEERKMTLPLIHLWHRLDENGRADLRAILEDTELVDRRQALLLRFDLTPDLARARARADEFIDKARESMLCFADSPIRRVLVDVCDFVVQREV